MGQAKGAGPGGRAAPSARQANSTVRTGTKSPPQPGTTKDPRGPVPDTESFKGESREAAETPGKEVTE